jgi:tagatose 1,6-diphosphate aldolase
MAQTSTQPSLPEAPPYLAYGATTLRFSHVGAGDLSRGLVPFYHYRIFVADLDVGHINFRVGDTDHVNLCAGHIGYGVAEPFRGRHYAYQACRALASFVRAVSRRVIITADPDNSASVRTIERLGAVFLDEIDVPENDPHFAHGARVKRRYLWSP